MPRYDYRCLTCDDEREISHRMDEDVHPTCMTCGSVMQRVIRNVGVVFRGDGFHCTDYAAERKSNRERD